MSMEQILSVIYTVLFSPLLKCFEEQVQGFLQDGGDRKTKVKHPKGFMFLQNLVILTIQYIEVIVCS